MSFSCSVIADSLKLIDYCIRLPCLSPSPGACSKFGDAIQPFHPLSSLSPPAFNLSQHQGLFQSALCIMWPKYWSSSFSITPSNEYSGLLSFRMDLFSLLSKLVLWTLKCDFHIIWRGGGGHTLRSVGSYFPDQGSNLHPLHWENRVLTTGLPGSPLI